MRGLRCAIWMLAVAVLAAPGLARAQMNTAGIVGIAGGAGVAGASTVPIVGAAAAPVAAPLVGGLVPLVGAIENIPCFLCVGVRVQPKEDDEFLQQYHTGLRAIPGFNTDLVVASPFNEGGRLTPDEQEQVLYMQFGMFDISVNPESNEVTFGYESGSQSRLPVFDALPVGAPIQQTDFRQKIGQLNADTGGLRSLGTRDISR